MKVRSNKSYQLFAAAVFITGLCSTCKPNQPTASSKTIDNATNSDASKFRLNDCQPQAGTTPQKTVQYLEVATGILQEKFMPGVRHSIYMPIMLDLLKDLPLYRIRMFVNDETLKIHVFDKWPDESRSCDKQWPGQNELGVLQGFACWSTNIPAGLFFGPGKRMGPDKNEMVVTTTDGFKHAFIRGLLRYQASKILAGLPSTTLTKEPTAATQVAFIKYSDHVLKTFKEEYSERSGRNGNLSHDELWKNNDSDLRLVNERRINILADILDSVYCTSTTRDYLKTNYPLTYRAALEQDGGGSSPASSQRD